MGEKPSALDEEQGKKAEQGEQQQRYSGAQFSGGSASGFRESDAPPATAAGGEGSPDPVEATSVKSSKSNTSD